jgi:uncharacterized membrane protein
VSDLHPIRHRNPGVGGEQIVRRTVTVATAAAYAAMYAVLALTFSPVSYGVINLRVANVLMGLVPLIGWPAVIGQGLGVFITNQPALGDPLGPLDLVNVIPSIMFAWIIWRLRNKSVFLGLTLYSVALGISVSLVLKATGNLYFGNSVGVGWAAVLAGISVFVGIFVVTALGGYALYKALRKLGIVQRRFGT